MLPELTAIRTAELFEIEARLVSPYTLSTGTLATTRAVLLKLTDVDGVVGWGEADPLQGFSADTTHSIRVVLEGQLLPSVFAEAAPLPAAVDAALDELIPGQWCAKGAVSMALLDLLGKRMRAPLAALFGGPLRTSLPVLWPLGNGSASDDTPVIEQKLTQGYTTFMLKMGNSPIPDEIARVASVESRFGDRVTLIIDANQGWTRDQARQFLEAVNGQHIAFVEQPLDRRDIEGLGQLAAITEIPLSVDESVTALRDIVEIARRGAAGVVSIKSSKNGGPLRADKIAAVAEAFGMRCYLNSMIEFGITQAASLQHGMTLPGLVDVGHAYMSTLRLAEDPTDFAERVRGGIVHADERPGLGITVDEAHVRALSRTHCTLDRP